MRSKNKYGTGVAVVAAAGAFALIALSAGGPAVADDEFKNTPASADKIQSTVRKTVAVSADAAGKVNSSMMVTQLSSNGKGQTTVKVPVGDGNSARNLDGFSSVPVEDGNAVFNLNLNGAQESRIMTNATPGPIEVTTETTLDGQPIEPGQVVNKSGVLKVKYTIVNKEKQVLEVPVQGKNGKTKMKEQEVDAPIGGSVAITLPQGFNEISAPGANIGGNGQGGSNLSYSLVMFKPLGNPVATIEYESRITDGTLPQAVFTMVPIVPMENSTIQTARSSFEMGAETGTKIAGAGQQFEDGGTELATGLQKAAAGTQKLSNGISNTLEPGANELSNGISNTLQPGANELARGITNTLQPGANELANGLKAGAAAAPALVTGVDKLFAGATELETALDALMTGTGTLKNMVQAAKQIIPMDPDFQSSAQTTNDGLDLLQMLIGTALPAGVDTVKDKATDAKTQAETAKDKATDIVNRASSVDDVADANAIITAADNVINDANDIITAADDLTGGLNMANSAVNAFNAQLRFPGTSGHYGLNPSLDVLVGKVQALLLGSTPDPKTCKAAQEGILALDCGITAAEAGSDQLKNGLGQLAKQAPGLVKGMQEAAAGAEQLAGGINNKLAPGASELAAGINNKLAPGAAQLANGISTELAPGAAELAAGLPAAVAGTEKIAAGGKELAAEGNAAGSNFGNQVNQIDAIQKLGLEGRGIPYGKATGENVTTTGAYQITLAAASSPQDNNAMRLGLAGLGLAGAAGVGTAVARRGA